jgi:hypothetical protein
LAIGDWGLDLGIGDWIGDWGLAIYATILNRQSAIGNRQSTNRQSAIAHPIGNRQLNRQSTIGNRQYNRQSAIGNLKWACSPLRSLTT